MHHEENTWLGGATKTSSSTEFVEQKKRQRRAAFRWHTSCAAHGMGNGMRIGRLFGIELRVDPSWLFIFILVAWSLTSLFGMWHPDWSLATSLIVALTAALLFFASVLFHELAHSLVALAYGIPVRDITLHLFGGVSNIEKEPPTPAAEFLMAIVGPMASIGLGIAMLVVSSVLIDIRATEFESAEVLVAQLGPLETLLVWLGPVNVIVGLFNMLPGFPLDGGRVLRAIVWRVTGSLDKATRVAGSAGQGVGWLFVVLGLAMILGISVPFFGRGVLSGLWLAMIGLFLRNAAVAHLRGATFDRAMSGVHVKDLMRTKGAHVEPAMPVRELLDDWFLRHDELSWPVIQNGVLSGIVSIDDLRKSKPEEWGSKTVRDIMTPVQRVVSSSTAEPLADALRKLSAAGVRQLPVVEGGLLVGMLYEKDVARWLELRSYFMRETPARLHPA